MKPKPDLPMLQFATQQQWEAWLDANHATSQGLWLKLAKAGAGVATVTYADALDSALCYGWIDGQKGALDDRFWRQRFTPRQPQSRWSKVNCTKAEALIRQDRVKLAGLKEIELARKDGRWERAYDSQKTAQVPPDLQRALDGNPKAQAFFASLESHNRYAILYRLQEAKRPETRASRLEKFVAMLTEGRKIHE